MPLPGWLPSSAQAGHDPAPLNELLPERFTAFWREAGDDFAFDGPAVEQLHVERTYGGELADVDRGPNGVDIGIIVALHRDHAYGGVLLDAFGAESAAGRSRGPEGFFFGDLGGDAISKYGETHLDKAAQVDVLAEYNPIAAGGPGGEAAYHTLYLVVSGTTTAELIVLPIVDGEKLTDAQKVITFIPGAARVTTRRYELPIRKALAQGGTERLRFAPRGTWFTVRITGHDSEGTGDLEIEECSVEAEVVRETWPERTFSILDLVDAQRPLRERFYFGEVGDGIHLYGLARSDLSSAVEAFLRPNELAPAGSAGECEFSTVYLAFTRLHSADVSMRLTPVVDGTTLPPVDFTLAASATPVADIVELPLSRPHLEGAVERFRYGLRGVWFAFELESVGALPAGSFVMLEGATLEYEVVRESEDPVT